MRIPLGILAMTAVLAAAAPAQEIPRKPDGTIQFRYALDNSPMDLDYRPEQTITDAVRQFHRTGENPYRGNASAIEAGRTLFNQWCASCHMPDATGRIGPSLVDDQYLYPRVPTDVGMFEVIYGGAAGAMQAFGQRIDQDQILKIMAYISRLREQHGLH